MSQLTCPKCQGAMRQYERSGVTVDQCSECRGLFLDRGELERLIDAETAWSGGAAAPAAPAPDPRSAPAPAQVHYQSGSHQPYRKKRSFLEELFD